MPEGLIRRWIVSARVVVQGRGYGGKLGIQSLPAGE
jgi:hypothetical protein